MCLSATGLEYTLVGGEVQGRSELLPSADYRCRNEDMPTLRSESGYSYGVDRYTPALLRVKRSTIRGVVSSRRRA